ncbi:MULTISPECIES: phosphotransferase [unclassified Nocardioides]|uniref:phosphotransferase n=1 Tax=unclassified Nocardioides TaxID=2615069 RepID=UPI00240642EF|nr:MULTISPECIES: phosphotransferase [unclassified Nocardioides]MDF9715784.1 phosphotransferase [Nocardioides sp. ChNu-99]
MDTRDLLEIAARLLPTADVEGARVDRSGATHDVVLLPGTAVVRVARSERAAAQLPRRTELLRRLGQRHPALGAPAVLTDVVDGAVALGWVDGAPSTRAPVPAVAALLRELATVDLDPLADVLGEPHEYAGRGEWAALLDQHVVERLPPSWRSEARRRIDAALALPPVEPVLVHGDLAGPNLLWRDGRLAGVVDWDLAQPFDPAVDAACLASFGWHVVRAVVDPATYARARTWQATFGLELPLSAVLDGRPAAEVDALIGRTQQWLSATAGRY